MVSLSTVITGLSISSSSASFVFSGESRIPTHADSSVSSQNPAGLVIEAAHKKGSGSTKNGRDSNPKMLGVKIYGDQVAQPGAIIVRQRGTKVRMGHDSDSAGRDFNDGSISVVFFFRSWWVCTIE